MSTSSPLPSPNPSASEAASGAANGLMENFGGEIITGIVAILVFTVSQVIDWRIRIGDREAYRKSKVIDRVTDTHWKRLEDYRSIARQAEKLAAILPSAVHTQFRNHIEDYETVDAYTGEDIDITDQVKRNAIELQKEVLGSQKEIDALLSTYIGESDIAADELTTLQAAVNEAIGRYWPETYNNMYRQFDVAELEAAVAGLRKRINELEMKTPSV